MGPIDQGLFDVLTAAPVGPGPPDTPGKVCVLMRNDRRFRPGSPDSLERREVLASLAVPGASAILSGAGAARAAGKARPLPLKDLADQAFDSFARDFTQARSAYLSGLGVGNNDPAASLKAFKSYVQNRLSLLAQQLISNGAPAGSKSHRSGGTLPGLVSRRIDGMIPPGDKPLEPFERYRAGSLGQSLSQSISALTLSNPQANALAVLAQDQAVEASRLAYRNGLRALRNSRN